MTSSKMNGHSFDLLEEIIRLSIDYLVVVDHEGTIIYLSTAYANFLGKTEKNAIGYPVQQVIENTRMHIVAKSGIKEVDNLQPINGSIMIANRYPLIINNQLLGALGTVSYPNPDYLRDQKNKMQDLIEELNFYKTKAEKQWKSKYKFKDLAGESTAFLSVKKFAEKVSGSNSSVLITGESGTGKELFAHSIHQSSLRSEFPIVSINCASIPEDLFESELFGYEDGAFTGAKKGGKKGLLEVANNGTVFLDEIGDMPLSMQSKLLRTLQEKEIQPIGGQKSINIDIRVVAATNKDLAKMVEKGTFRQDLYYRLNVINIEIPPLRKRIDDIEVILNTLLKKLERKFYRNRTTVSTEVVKILKQHSWPGNIRELENVLERSINVLEGNRIKLTHLPLYLQESEINYTNKKLANLTIPINSSEVPVRPLKETIKSVEKQVIKQALEFTNGNKQEAAKLLKIGKTSFYEKCKVHDIT